MVICITMQLQGLLSAQRAVNLKKGYSQLFKIKINTIKERSLLKMIVLTMASNNFSVDFFARKEGRICDTLRKDYFSICSSAFLTELIT